MPETALSSNPPATNVPEYSVRDIAFAIKRVVEDTFGRVRVRGEISAWKVHSSGHAYFRLKDAEAVLDAVCWRGTLGKVGCKAEDGLEVIATGRISTYPGKSSYQIIVERMEPAGAGALMALLEKRKTQLAAEGLFDAARKKPLPFMPRVIGVITSPTGAVIRDILHRISDRFPAHVLVWPVAVQGEGAAEQVAAAIRAFPHFVPRPDVLIVARGGGSVEDLWAFNEEIVVRAAAACTIPLISAVGHETDTTLIDFVSDQRAPTPTAAAEMATPVREELRLGLAQLRVRKQEAMQRLLRAHTDRLTGYKRGLPRPGSVLEHATQRLDDWSERLKSALPAALTVRMQQLERCTTLLRPQLLVRDIKKHQERLTELHQRLHTRLLRLLAEKEREIAAQSQLLASLSYENILKRGFALVRDAKGQVVTHTSGAKDAKTLRLQFQDGEVAAIVSS